MQKSIKYFNYENFFDIYQIINLFFFKHLSILSIFISIFILFQLQQLAMKKSKRNNLNYLGGSISILVNALLFALKLWAGIISGSIALIADAWHTLSDSLSSVIVIAGIKLSSKKPDKEHPFGHGRWEQIATIFIGVFLVFVAYEIMKNSVIKFSNQEAADFGIIAILVIIISIIFKELLAQMSFYIGRKTDSPVMKADAWHHRSDSLTSVVLLIGMFLQDYFWWIDSIMGIILSLVLFYVSVKIFKNAINKIIGEQIPKDTKTAVCNIIKEKYDTELNAHHFHFHNYGNHKEITFHIKVKNNLSVEEAHNIAYNIEKEISDKLNISATIHVEPKD